MFSDNTPSFGRKKILQIISVALSVFGISFLSGSSPEGRFNAVDGKVSDSITGLVWEQGASSEYMTWNEAENYCNSLVLDGGGWRLPTMKEIQTLVDESRMNPAIDADFFPDGIGLRFWTSSRPEGNTELAWLFDSAIGHVYTQETDHSAGIKARCVR